jgi:hypothetical protein
VQVAGNDYGDSVVGYEHTGVQADPNQANPAYVAKLRADDKSLAMQTGVARNCSYSLTAPATADDTTSSNDLPNANIPNPNLPGHGPHVHIGGHHHIHL